jgi:tetratricopeptide (TPR) repeat protein
MTALLDLRRRFASTAPTSVASIMVIVVLVVLGDSRALAQSAEAEALFNDGKQLLAEHKLAQACQAFEGSNHIEPRAGTLILLGECREQNQQLASAWSAYKDALARVKDPRYRDLANAKVAALQPRLSYLTVVVSDEGRVDDLTIERNGKSLDSLLWNRALPVDGGDYIITGHAPGHEEWQTAVHVPIEGAKLRVEVPTLKELPAVASPPAQGSLSPPALTPASPPGSPQGDHDAPAAPHTTSKVVPFVVAAGAFSLLGAGVGFELWAESNYAAAKSEMASQPRRDSLYNAANTKRHAAEAFAATGLAAGGAALWLYLRDRTREPGAMTSTRIQVVPTAAGLAVSGQF